MLVLFRDGKEYRSKVFGARYIKYFYFNENSCYSYDPQTNSIVKGPIMSGRDHNVNGQLYALPPKTVIKQADRANGINCWVIDQDDGSGADKRKMRFYLDKKYGLVRRLELIDPWKKRRKESR